MSSLFADTYNVVAILEKSDAAEGFEQIIDFLNDVTRSQALVDKKKIMHSKVVIREILTSWNEFSTAMASAVICLSKGQKLNFSKYIFDSLVRNVDSSSKFYMYPQFIQLIIQNQVGDLSTHSTRFISPALTQKVFANIRRVSKGFSGVETPLSKGILAARQLAEEGLVKEQVQADDAVGAAVLENVAKDGRMIDDLDKDEEIELVKDADIAKTEGRHAAKQAEKQAEIYHLDLDHSSKVLSMQEDDSEVQEVVEVVTTAGSQVSAANATISAAKLSIPAAVPTVVAAYTKRRKRVIIRDPEEELSLKTPAETPKMKDKGKGILIETPKPMKKKDQIKLDAEY
nr:hypothetical protein [Tanacetum cinerariifolium]